MTPTRRYMTTALNKTRFVTKKDQYFEEKKGKKVLDLLITPHTPFIKI